MTCLAITLNSRRYMVSVIWHQSNNGPVKTFVYLRGSWRLHDKLSFIVVWSVDNKSKMKWHASGSFIGAAFWCRFYTALCIHCRSWLLLRTVDICWCKESKYVDYFSFMNHLSNSTISRIKWYNIRQCHEEDISNSNFMCSLCRELFL